MADEVQVFHDDLVDEVVELDASFSMLTAIATSLRGDDVGVENPAHRPSLRLEMRRRFDALHDLVDACINDVIAIRVRLRAISDRFSDLDLELTGTERP